MKAQFLKIAKCKDEKSFYKKYPTQEAFFKAHPEAKKSIKKAEIGAYIGGDTMANAKRLNFQDYYDDADKAITGSTEKERQEAAKANAASSDSKGGGGGFDMSSIMDMFGGAGDASARYGSHIPKAQKGVDVNSNGIPDFFETNQPMQRSVQGPFNKPQMAGDEGSPPPIPGFSAKGMSQIDTIKQNEQITQEAPQAFSPLKTPINPLKGIPILGQVGDVLNAFEAQNQKKKQAKQSMLLSGLQLDLSRMRPEQIERRYNTPWDNTIQPDQTSPTYGVGTNVLTRNGGIINKAQYGSRIGGNPTQTSNNYGPDYTLYDNLGYEPLNDSNVKQYYGGGYIPKAQGGGGFSNFMNSGGGDVLNSAVGQGFDNNAGYQAGSAIGGFSDFIVPGSSAIVQPILGATFGAIDQAFGDAGKIKKYQKEAERNTMNTAMNNMAPGIQAAYASNMKDGGYMNPEYNPQVITMFGDHNAQDFADYANKYRAGGHLKSYTAPSERAMEIYEDGGEVNNYELGGVSVDSGGYLEPISYNPYNDGTGVTSMIKGQSHDEYNSKLGHSGVILDAYGNKVEAERGEPIREMKEGGAMGNDQSAVITGNLVYKNLNNMFDSSYNKYQGEKIKNIHKKIALKDQKLNKEEEKNTNELVAYDPKTPQDKLYGASLEAKKIGFDMQYMNNAKDANYFTNYQSIINDTAEEQGLVADDLAKGRIKQAKFGASVSKAKNGITTTKETTAKPEEYTSIEELTTAGFKQNAKGEWYRPKDGTKKTSTEKKSASAMDNIPKQSVDKTSGLFGGVTPAQFEAYKKKNSWYPNWDKFDPTREEDVNDYAKAFNAEAEKRGSKARIMSDELDPKTKKPIPGGKTKYVGKQLVSGVLEDAKEETPGAEDQDYAMLKEPSTKPIPYKRSPLIDIGNQVLDYLRPTDQEPFDYSQAMAEMYALNDQVEPVQAQGYRPDLLNTYDISLQDQLNANQADFNSTQRLFANNPFALAQFQAQKYAANEKILGEQFRQNQAMDMGVYNANTQTLNDAKLKNLGIFDQQYERQTEAKANTKAGKQAALTSLQDKIAKNKLENKTLGVYENLYKYRYDDKGRAINMNGIFQPNIDIVGGVDATQKQVPVKDANGNILYYQLEKYDPSANGGVGTPPIKPVSKNGKSINKNNKNSSIVKAIKNL